MADWRTLLASDVSSDGLGLELYDANDQLCAEVLRRDAERRVVFYTYREIPQETLAWFVTQAQEQLDPFEDGTSLPHPGSWDRGAA